MDETQLKKIEAQVAYCNEQIRRWGEPCTLTDECEELIAEVRRLQGALAAAEEFQRVASDPQKWSLSEPGQ